MNIDATMAQVDRLQQALETAEELYRTEPQKAKTRRQFSAESEAIWAVIEAIEELLKSLPQSETAKARQLALWASYEVEGDQ